MKHLSAFWLVMLAPALASAGDPLKEARQALLRGNYAEARAQYEELDGARENPFGVFNNTNKFNN